jgi:hypothetical protein
VNTTNPQSELSVIGVSRAAFSMAEKNYIEMGHGGNNSFINAVGLGNIDIRHMDQNIMTLGSNLRVGIGTNSPNAKFSVIGQVRGAFLSNENEYIEIWHGGDNGFINTVGDGNLDFRHDNNTLMSLNDGGSLFIGFNNGHIPSSKLEVNGTIKIGDDGVNEEGSIRYSSGKFQGAGSGALWYDLTNDPNDERISSLSLNGNSIEIEEGPNTHSIDLSPIIGSGDVVENKCFALDDPDMNESMGRSVAIEGGDIRVGVPVEVSGTGIGKVYKFSNDANGWYNTNGKISGGSGSINFGDAIHLDNGRLIVGEPGFSANTGRVHLYSVSACCVTPLDEVQASDGASPHRFGKAVSVSGNFVVIGADFKDSGKGGAYIYRYNGSDLIDEVILEEIGTVSMGKSVDIDGNYAAVGAPTTTGQGEVFIYFYNGSSWNLQQTLTTVSNVRFGYSLSLDGDKLVVGSNAGSTDEGFIEIWKRTGSSWNIEQTIVPPDSRPGDGYGKSVAIQGDNLVFGAPGVDYNADNNVGAIYYYTFDGVQWNFVKKFFATNRGFGDEIGTSISLDGNTFVTGGPEATINGESAAGKIYIDTF